MHSGFWRNMRVIFCDLFHIGRLTLTGDSDRLKGPPRFQQGNALLLAGSSLCSWSSIRRVMTSFPVQY